MELFEAIGQRYCYRGPFTDEAIPHADLEQIVQAGLDAPSGKNAQTTRFVIVDNPYVCSRVREILSNNDAMMTAQAYIIAFIDREPEAVYEGFAFQIEDCAAAVENILLAATALGYATVWADGVLRLQQRAEKLGALLGVPETKIARIILPLGVPVAPGPRREKLPFGERAWFNRWGA